MQAPTTNREPCAAYNVTSGLIVLMGGLLWLLPAIGCVFIVPKFAEIYSKFEMEPSPSAQAVIAFARAVTTWWWAFGVAWVVVVGGLVVLAVAVRQRWTIIASVVFAAASLVAVVVVAFVLVLLLSRALVETVQAVGAQ